MRPLCLAAGLLPALPAWHATTAGPPAVDPPPRELPPKLPAP